MIGTLTTSDGLELAYDVEGVGAAVVLVHGLGLSRRRWDRVKAALLGAGYRVARFDLRGFGDSQLARYGYDGAVADEEIRTKAEEVLASVFDQAPPLAMFRKGLEEPNPAQAFGWQATMGFSTKDELGALTCPVLVLHGTSDPVIPLSNGRALHRALPDGTLYVELAGGGHHLPVQRADDVAEAPVSFLADVTQTGV